MRGNPVDEQWPVRNSDRVSVSPIWTAATDRHVYRSDVTAGGLAEFATSPGLPAATGDPVALGIPARNWLHWLGLGISVAVLVAILFQVEDVSFREMRSMLPVTAAFWLSYCAYYLAPIASEWLIFRRLWRIPAAGIAALTRKYVSNEVLLGYVGEVYFYVWARKRSRMVGAPFGAIKDVAILSAVVGNALTLGMMALAFPFLAELQVGMGGRLFYLSIIVIVMTSLAALFFRRRLFSLPPAELRFVIVVHVARILATTGLAALMWHLILPDVALMWWVLLAALRLLLSRLPFLPNKDLAFAGLAVIAVGHESEIATMLTMIASLLLATHVALGLLLTSAELAGLKERT